MTTGSNTDLAGEESFDVFLSHNSRDKPTVRQLAQALQAQGLKVWLDEEPLVPGWSWQDAVEKIIQTAHTAVVFVGKDGLGPWDDPEMGACLSALVERRMPVIPVLLADAPVEPKLPPFLSALTWVDLRAGLSDDGLERLVRRINGNKPDRCVPTNPTRGAEGRKCYKQAARPSRPHHGPSMVLPEHTPETEGTDPLGPQSIRSSGPTDRPRPGATTSRYYSLIKKVVTGLIAALITALIAPMASYHLKYKYTELTDRKKQLDNSVTQVIQRVDTMIPLGDSDGLKAFTDKEWVKLEEEYTNLLKDYDTFQQYIDQENPGGSVADLYWFIYYLRPVVQKRVSDPSEITIFAAKRQRFQAIREKLRDCITHNPRTPWDLLTHWDWLFTTPRLVGKKAGCDNPSETGVAPDDRRGGG